MQVFPTGNPPPHLNQEINVYSTKNYRSYNKYTVITLKGGSLLVICVGLSIPAPSNPTPLKKNRQQGTKIKCLVPGSCEDTVKTTTGTCFIPPTFCEGSDIIAY